MFRRAQRSGRPGAALAATAIAALAFAAPAVAAETFVGLDDDGVNLRTFKQGAETVVKTTPITGLSGGVTIKGIDFRPQSTATITTQLFALGSDKQLYTINPTTGAATNVNATTTVGVDGGIANLTQLTAPQIGFDFNPQVDAIRITDSTPAVITGTQVTPGPNNARYQPTNKAGIMAGYVLNSDGGLNSAAGGEVIGDVAYTNAFPTTTPATLTTLFGIDATGNQLVRQGDANFPGTGISPNSGTLTAIGALGAGDITEKAGFDILGTNKAFAALNTAASTTSTLYSINVGTGAASAPVAIGTGNTLAGLTIANGGDAQFSVASAVISETDGNVSVTVERDGGDGRAVTVDYATANGTATAGTDYTATSGTLAFAQGQGAKTFTVPITDDAAIEAVETFTVKLGNPVGGAVLGTKDTQTVSIVSDDVSPVAPGTPSAAFALKKPLGSSKSKAVFNFVCSETCTVKAVLKKGRKTIGKGSASGGATDSALKVKFTKAGKKLVKRAKAGDSASLEATVTGSGGGSRSVKTPLTFR